MSFFGFWQGPAERIFKWGRGGGLLRTRKREQTRGDPRACSPGKISNSSLLKWLYSQLSLRRTPLGPALSVRLKEVSVL